MNNNTQSTITKIIKMLQDRTKKRRLSVVRSMWVGLPHQIKGMGR